MANSVGYNIYIYSSYMTNLITYGNKICYKKSDAKSNKIIRH